MQRINTPDGAFHEGDDSTGEQGTIVTQAYMQSLQEEVAGAVEAAGMQLDPNNNGQLLAAILTFIEARAGEYLLDTGAANAYVVAMNPAVGVYASGLTVKFRIAHGISGNSTLNAGPGPVPLVRDDGTPTQNGDGPAGSILTATYDGPSGAFLINSVVPSQIAAQIAAILAASPALGGTPTVPTAPAGTTTTQAANCAYVENRFAGVSAKQATETTAGIAAIATQALANAGTDDTTIVTPKKMAAAIANMINNTGASSDITLQVGQVAYIDVAAATTVPLHIATGDNQQYEISFAFTGVNYSPSGGSLLLPNNASITNMFEEQVIQSFGATAQGTSAYNNGFMLSNGQTRNVVARVYTSTACKTVISYGTTLAQGMIYSNQICSVWLSTASSLLTQDTTTLWASLGTLTFSIAVTGRITIRRTA